MQLWDTELVTRKRKLPEGGAIPDDSAVTPVKNVRNIPVNTNQKHLNLSQIYSKFSQPATSEFLHNIYKYFELDIIISNCLICYNNDKCILSLGKTSGQTKHSYNQVSKVSTSKSNQTPYTPDKRSGQSKHRQHKQTKNAAQIVISKSQMKKSHDLPLSSSKQYSTSQMDYSGSSNSFQASYAQSILGHKSKPDYIDEMKPKLLSPSTVMSDSPTMQLLTQPATVPHELGVSDGAHTDNDPSSLQAKAMHTSNKPCHLIIKKKADVSDKKLQMSDIKLLQKPSEGLKVLSNRQVVVAPSSAQKALNTPAKLVTTKIIGSVPKHHNTPTIIKDKMIVVSKASDQKGLTNSKIVITSTAVTAPSSKEPLSVTTSSVSPNISESIVAKGIPATDLRVSAKTFLLNPKSGQKVVVLPGKPKTKTTADGHTVPLLHFKGVPTTMKLVPVSSQPGSQILRPSPVTVVSKPTIINTMPAASPKILGIEPIKTANMADIVPVRGLTPIPNTPKTTNAIVRPTSGKGSVIVVQKGATISKTLSFTKNGNEMSKIIMGKNVSQLLQASNVHKSEQAELAKSSNVIVLELNNDVGRPTTMSEILEGCSSNTNQICQVEKTCQAHEEITEDTPVLFENQISEEQTCNNNSLDSASGSISDIGPMEESIISIEKLDECKSNYSKDSECTKNICSRVTDWEMELDTVTRKEKDDDDKLNSLHLDLGMSSDSESDYIDDSHKSENKHSTQEIIERSTPSGKYYER